MFLYRASVSPSSVPAQMLLRVNPFSDTVAQIESSLLSQSSMDNDTAGEQPRTFAILRAQVDALISTTMFLQGQVAVSQQTIFALTDQLHETQARNTSLSNDIELLKARDCEYSKFKYNNLRLSDTSHVHKRGRRNGGEDCSAIVDVVSEGDEPAVPVCNEQFGVPSQTESSRRLEND